ncbi:MAG: hypothetical protein J7M18_04290 [Candidatus Eremiobacteraeota bacterium]|nr:hypothetical protein [Candidatus Eremiobacteraeota bacterium]
MSKKQRIFTGILLLFLGLTGLVIVATGKFKIYNRQLYQNLKEKREELAKRIQPAVIKMAGDLPYNPRVANNGHTWIMYPGGKKVTYGVVNKKLVRIENGKEEILATDILEIQIHREKGTYNWNLFIKAYMPSAPPGTRVMFYNYTFTPAGGR